MNMCMIVCTSSLLFININIFVDKVNKVNMVNKDSINVKVNIFVDKVISKDEHLIVLNTVSM